MSARPFTGSEPGGAAPEPSERISWAAWMLAGSLDALEALLAGKPVPRASLKPDALAALGEPEQGPDITLTEELALDLALRYKPQAEGDDAPLVDGAGLLEEVAAFVRRYVAMTPAQAAACALWIAHTYAADAAEATPYLSVISAEKRSGKTRLLEVLELLVSGPLAAGNATIAAVFRSLAKPPTTLLMDEVDAVFGPKASANHEDLRALLNSGYRPGMPVLRCVGEGSKQRVEAFAVYCPKALAGIGALPDTLADRSIVIRLKRARRDERVRRFRRREARAAAEPLRARLARFGEEHVDTLAEARPDLPDELDDRAQDGWEALLAIADLSGGDWPERARAAALELSGEKAAEDDSLGVRLLGDILRAFEAAGTDRISTADLIEALASDEEAPWADWRGGKITPRSLARLLRRFEIKGGPVRLETGVARGFRREQFTDAWSRYVPPDTAPEALHGLHPAPHAGSRPLPDALHEGDVTDSGEAANPHEHSDVTHVTDRPGDQGDGGPRGEEDAWLATASMDELRARYGEAVAEPEQLPFRGEEPPPPAFRGEEPGTRA